MKKYFWKKITICFVASGFDEWEKTGVLHVIFIVLKIYFCPIFHTEAITTIYFDITASITDQDLDVNILLFFGMVTIL